MQTPGDVLTLHLLTWTGAAFIAAYLLYRCRRGYLLYLGAGFICGAVILFSTGLLLWLAVAVMPVMFILAFINGAGEMKERLRLFRVEQREREAAFAEYQLALFKRD